MDGLDRQLVLASARNGRSSGLGPAAGFALAVGASLVLWAGLVEAARLLLHAVL